MLTAKVGNSIINTIDNLDSDIRKWSDKGIIKCPYCGNKMVFRNGKIKVKHFSHVHKCSVKYYYYENETNEHMQGKKLLYEWLKKQDNIDNLKMEAWVPETHQRPDIYFEQNNKRFVVEYQCSPISSEYLERHKLYQLAGINDIWILGTEKYKNSHKFIEKYADFYLNPKNNCVKPLDFSVFFKNSDITSDLYFKYSNQTWINVLNLTFNNDLCLSLKFIKKIRNFIKITKIELEKPLPEQHNFMSENEIDYKKISVVSADQTLEVLHHKVLLLLGIIDYHRFDKRFNSHMRYEIISETKEDFSSLYVLVINDFEYTFKIAYNKEEVFVDELIFNNLDGASDYIFNIVKEKMQHDKK